MKREAQFTTKFRKWLQSREDAAHAAAYEIKVSTDKSIPFSAVKEHQVGALKQVKHGMFSQKIPDAGWQNPFDLFVLCKQEAYVVLAFLEPRKKTQVWIIDIDLFLRMQEVEDRKSMNYPMLAYYADTEPDYISEHLI